MRLGKGVNELSFGGPDTPQRNWKNILDVMRAFPVRVFSVTLTRDQDQFLWPQALE